MKANLERSDLGLELKLGPDRGFWNMIVLPFFIVVAFKADYNILGQVPMEQFIGRYVVGTLLIALFFYVLFYRQRITVTVDELIAESEWLNLRRRRAWLLREIEHAYWDVEAGSTSYLRIKLSGRALLPGLAAGISREQAGVMLEAMGFSASNTRP